MTAASPADAPRKPLRLWPGVALVAVLWLVRLGAPLVSSTWVLGGLLGGLAGALAILVWWAFFSRARWQERVVGVLLVLGALALTPPLLHESLATAGMGVLFFAYSVPVVGTALVLWAWATRNVTGGARWASMIASVVLACVAWTPFRIGGMSGDADLDFAWRWTPDAEQQLLAASAGESLEAPAATALAQEAQWPGFRGPYRDSRIPGIRIDTDWESRPPRELWRRPVGPGWSSFAVLGDLIYTQEQRGEDEVVSCYSARTGQPVWRHADPVRFWEANAGAGPRATPTVIDGRVYTLGATGIVNALDASTGAVVWSRDVVTDAGASIPGWGFAGSPLVIGDVVLIAAAGQLVAYDRDSGEQRWAGPTSAGYSSPHLLTLDGAPQVVLLGSGGATSVEPTDGSTLWEFPWSGEPIVQPALIDDGDLLVTTVSAAGGAGMRRLSVRQGSSGWSVAERWTSNRLKPYFSDYVVHEGSAYGFDGSIMACIDLETGERQWKGGRYGHGQLVLLADQGILLVLSEQGELALVRAIPDGFSEIARAPAIEGKTWNHPALVGDLLLVRNAEEMAAFRLALATT